MTPLRGAAVVLILLSPALAGCMAGAGDPPDVVTTFYPLTFLVQEIGGPELTVATLVGAGQEPHSWAPTIGDLQTIQGAGLLVAQGAGMEPWLGDLRERVGQDGPALVTATDGLELLGGGHADHAEAHEEDHGDEHEEDHDEAPAEQSREIDPHTWMHPARYAQQARTVQAGLAAAFPEQADAFGQRADALVDALDGLDARYTEGLSDCEVPFIVVNHNAFAYTAAAYGFEVASVFGLQPEAESTPQHVREIIQQAREHNVTLVFRETLASPKTMERVAGEIGAEVGLLHTIGGLTEAEQQAGEDYLTLMDGNLDRLQEAMRCR